MRVKYHSGNETQHVLKRTGVLYAFGAAALFGASTPLAKLLLGNVDPLLLAGMLYLGSGLGLAIVGAAMNRFAMKSDARLSLDDMPWLIGAIFCGGLIGPILLMIGLNSTPASVASLLLSMEGVMTAAIAWIVFRENFDKRIAFGMTCIVAGAAILAYQGFDRIDSVVGPLAIIGACLAWGVDNNLTRNISLSDPIQIAMLKGLVSGVISLGIAFSVGARLPHFDVAIAAAFVGLFGYGISLVLFVLALRHLGTARTGAYFSTAPFLGAAIALQLNGDALTPQFAVAGTLMAVGVWAHLTEWHVHEHTHEDLEHEHSHVHDIHHQHTHAELDPPGAPHLHHHAHLRLRHSHPHVPDAHHRHSH